MANGRVNGKQIIDDTVIKTINGLTFSDQYIISNNDSNVTLTIATSGSTHSFTMGWTGSLALNRGGLGNTSFTASQILIVDSSTSSIISSSYKFNNIGTSSTDIWDADKIISYINNKIINLGSKAGRVSGASFSGNPKTANVIFDTPFSGLSYSTSIIGNSSRAWSISNQTSTGFTINSNANQTITGDVYWMCLNNGESSAANKGQLGVGLNGNGAVITTGVKSYLTVPYSGIITGWELLSTATGSIVIDVWKDTYANYPPTLSDSICGIDKPTLSNQIKNNNNNLTAWSTTITEGDIIAFNVDSASVVTQVTLTLKINKT
jgi:hypothetical protein